MFPFISGLDANKVYRAALKSVGQYLPFHSLDQREACGKMLAAELADLGLVNPATKRIDPQRFQEFVAEKKDVKGDTLLAEEEDGNQ